MHTRPNRRELLRAAAGATLPDRETLAAGAEECTFEGVELPPGPGRLEAWLTAAGRDFGARYADVRRARP